MIRAQATKNQTSDHCRWVCRHWRNVQIEIQRLLVCRESKLPRFRTIDTEIHENELSSEPRVGPAEFTKRIQIRKKVIPGIGIVAGNPNTNDIIDKTFEEEQIFV